MVGPTAYAPGAQLAVVRGDPTKEGMYVKLDQSEGIEVKAGGYSFVMKGMTHYAWLTEDTVLQLHGMGPQG